MNEIVISFNRHTDVKRITQTLSNIKQEYLDVRWATLKLFLFLFILCEHETVDYTINYVNGKAPL